MGCDHGGLELKNNLKVYLTGKGFEVIDVGTHTTDAVCSLLSPHTASSHVV